MLIPIRNRIPLLNLLFSHLNHLTSERSDTGRNLQARQLSNLRACETIHRVRADLKRELSAVKHGLLHGICRFLEVVFGTFTSAQELVENLGEDSFLDAGLDECVAVGRLGDVLWREVEGVAAKVFLADVLCVCVCVCLGQCVCVCVCVCLSLYIDIYIYIYIYTNTHTHVKYLTRVE
jgi:hypothetical protein